MGVGIRTGEPGRIFKFNFFNFIIVPVGVAGAVGIGLPSAFGSRRVKGLPVLGAYPLPDHLLQC